MFFLGDVTNPDVVIDGACRSGVLFTLSGLGSNKPTMTVSGDIGEEDKGGGGVVNEIMT